MKLKAEPELGFELWKVDGEGEGRERKGMVGGGGGSKTKDHNLSRPKINNKIIFILLFCTLLTFIK